MVTPDVLDDRAIEFERSGLRKSINRDRNHERDFGWVQAFKNARPG